jgi:hypothetical protein
MLVSAMPEVLIQTGPRNARTIPGTGLRFYTWRGNEYPSVTTIRRLAGLPHGLHQWQISRVIEAAMARAPDIMQAFIIPGQVEKEAALTLIRSDLRAAATAERDAAARLGTSVHDAAAKDLPLDHPGVSPEMRSRLAHFHDWLDESRAVVLASEFQCWNLTVGYAGTADLLVRMPQGEIWLVDLKTGKSIYGEHALQLIAYLMAEFVGADDVVDDALTGLLQKVDGIAILHLSEEGWEFDVIRSDRQTWDAYRGLLTFATWMRSHERADDVRVASRKGKAKARAAS